MQASIDQSKRRVLVWEADTSKGGVPAYELRRQCPTGVEAAVFDGKEVIPWQRIADFQLVTLKAIAEQLLLASPVSKIGRL